MTTRAELEAMRDDTRCRRGTSRTGHPHHHPGADMKRIKLSDGSSWPRPDIEDDEDLGLAWRLTYTTPTRADLLAAASVISAYEHMILATDRTRRDFVCREVRAAIREEIAAATPGSRP